MIQITDVYHNGTSWVANCINSETGHVKELPISDHQSNILKDFGVPIYDPND